MAIKSTKMSKKIGVFVSANGAAEAAVVEIPSNSPRHRLQSHVGGSGLVGQVHGHSSRASKQ